MRPAELNPAAAREELEETSWLRPRRSRGTDPGHSLPTLPQASNLPSTSKQTATGRPQLATNPNLYDD